MVRPLGEQERPFPPRSSSTVSDSSVELAHGVLWPLVGKGNVMSDHTESTPFAGSVVTYTLAAFAEDLRGELEPAGIAAQVEEWVDGTRTVRAWPVESPDTVSIFPIDQVRLLPYQAHVVATAIRRSLAASDMNRPG